MKIELTHRQNRYTLDEAALERFAEWVMDKIAALDPSFNWTELSIVLTDDTIRELNRDWFGKDTVTDVISFAYPDAGLGGGDTGEIILNLDQAAGEGRLRESPDHELALYLAHGCHHLTGAEDDTPARKQAMLALESAWVEEARAQNLIGPFFV